MKTIQLSEREAEQLYDLLVHLDAYAPYMPENVNRQALKQQLARLKQKLYG